MRFVAFGCSHTWGDGIVPGDTRNQREANGGIGFTLMHHDSPPSKFSWVQHLSNKFNVPVLNLACSGSSNAYILHKIRNHDWQKDDIGLILWTFIERDVIFEDTNIFEHVGPNFGKYNKYSKKYYKIFPKFHNEFMSLMHIEHAYFYLRSKNISMISRFYDKDITLPLDNFDKKMAEDFQKIALLEVYNLLTNKFKKPQVGADGMHCNSLVHELFAQSIEPELSQFINQIS